MFIVAENTGSVNINQGDSLIHDVLTTYNMFKLVANNSLRSDSLVGEVLANYKWLIL